MENNSFSNEPSPNSSLPWVEKYRPKDFDNIVLDFMVHQEQAKRQPL